MTIKISIPFTHNDLKWIAVSLFPTMFLIGLLTNELVLIVFGAVFGAVLGGPILLIHAIDNWPFQIKLRDD